MTLRVTDHALVRFLEREGFVDIETVRAAIEALLERAARTARRLGETDYAIRVDSLIYLVRDGAVVTVVSSPKRRRRRRG